MKFGWSSGLRLSIFYALLFSLVAAVGFLSAYRWIASVVRGHEMDVVKDRAAEYRAWFISGETEMLDARMDEQSLKSGDVMFVHLTGPDLDYVKYVNPGNTRVPVADIDALDPTTEGDNIDIGGDHWVVASQEMGFGGLVLQAGKNSRAADATLSKLRWIFTVTFVPTMVGATLFGALLAFRGMAPIRRLILTMRGILATGELNARVEPEPRRTEFNGLVALFNQLLARNEKLIGSMQQSLDSVAHDFRTPLSRLNMTAQRAIQGGGDPDEMRDALADCVEEAQHLDRLLTTLLDVAEAESGAMRLNLEPVSLPDLVEGVAELYEFVAEEKEISVETDLPETCMVMGDQTRLNQVLANLLDNAIKYGKTRGNVRISVVGEGRRAIVSMTDDGIGIPEADLPHIWDRLYRAEPSRQTSGGMGLGLSFVRAIVQAHNGSVSVERCPGGGTTFKVELPKLSTDECE